MSAAGGQTLEFVVRRHIRAKPDRVFAAWTDPDELLRWWGPTGVVCTEAEVDLRVGGSFRLANKLPDGQVVWISGSYQEVDPPHRLRHTWVVDSIANGEPSHVTVTFEAADGGTDVVITHGNIVDQSVHDSHQGGWNGCLDGLAQFIEPTADQTTG